MNFIEVTFSADQAMSDILLAELSLGPFNTFEEADGLIKAYAEEEGFDESFVNEVSTKYQIEYSTAIIPKENWNETWEQNYDPIIVDDQVLVKATFHSDLPSYPIEVLVDPKMSFGTGHHATTHLMISAQLKIDHHNKSVADLGTGTGILAIVAAKLCAMNIEGSDIDDWCIENSRDNFELNDLKSISTQKADAQNFNYTKPFDIVLANINKNVLLSELAYYSKFCKGSGYLLLSGFYKEDVPDLVTSAKSFGFSLVSETEKDNWAQLTFTKSE
ncbi:MAG: 50S ribosomal protein L11 methyltransferase [Bacteroidota bacterium]